MILFIISVIISEGNYMFLNLVDKSEPKIVNLETPIKIVGVSMKTNMKSIYKDAVILGKKYQKVKPAIQNKKISWAFAAISKNFSIDKSCWEYLMGDVVTSFDDIPDNLITFEIPVKTYAVFTIRPVFKFLWGPAIGLTKKYIFMEWLSDSKYDSDDSILGDFEYHDERSISKKPSIDLYVSIKRKSEK